MATGIQAVFPHLRLMSTSEFLSCPGNIAHLSGLPPAGEAGQSPSTTSNLSPAPPLQDAHVYNTPGESDSLSPFDALTWTGYGIDTTFRSYLEWFIQNEGHFDVANYARTGQKMYVISFSYMT